MKKCKTKDCKAMLSPNSCPDFCPECQEANAERKLQWLIEALQKNHDRNVFMLNEARAMAEQPQPANSKEPAVVYKTKVATRRAIYGQAVQGTQWLLSDKRPWIKKKK